MIITNKYGLPSQFYELCKSDHKTKDKVYSVTTIMKDVKEIMLSRRYGDVVEQDCSDMVWLVLGSAVHKALEDSKESDDELKETYFQIDVGNGYKLSGLQDLYSESEKKIIDWKTASVNKVLFNDWKDYKLQITIYAWCFKQLGFEVEQGEIVAILKDYNLRESKLNKDYPKCPVYVVNFKITDEDMAEVERYIKNKFKQIQEAEKLADNLIQECSDEARWYTGTTYAVMKDYTSKRAVRVFQTRKEAVDYCSYKKDNYIIVRRQGENRKCENYCLYKDYCNFYKNTKKLQELEEDD